MPLLTTEKDIRDLINRDPDASKVAQTFFDALKPVGNKVAAEIGKLMLQGQPIPGGVDAGGALVAAGFRMAGASEQEAGLGAAVGKFAILSAALGGAGAVIGAPGVVFSVIAYLDAADAAEEKAMRAEIVASMTAKMNDIVAKAEAKKLASQQADAAREVATDADDPDAANVLFWYAGEPITLDDINAARSFLGADAQSRLAAATDLDIASVYVEQEQAIEAFRAAGNKYPDDDAEAEADGIKQELVEELAARASIGDEGAGLGTGNAAAGLPGKQVSGSGKPGDIVVPGKRDDESTTPGGTTQSAWDGTAPRALHGPPASPVPPATDAPHMGHLADGMQRRTT